jgi:hypothetical protein
VSRVSYGGGLMSTLANPGALIKECLPTVLERLAWESPTQDQTHSASKPSFKLLSQARLDSSRPSWMPQHQL